jgi:PAS domain S-box-containing protein
MEMFAMSSSVACRAMIHERFDTPRAGIVVSAGFDSDMGERVDQAARRGSALELSRAPASRIAVLVVIAAVYFAAGKAGLTLAVVHVSATPVWPPTGIALATFLLLGYRPWPAIFLGAFLVNWTTAGSVTTSLAIATGNTLEGVVGALLVRKFAHGVRAFDLPSDILRFLVLAAGVAPTLSATIGVTSLALGGFAPWRDFDAIWTTWWLGNAMGALIVAPLLVLAAVEPWPRLDRVGIAELAALLVGLLATALLVFRGIVPFAFLCIPFPLWAAFRFGPREAAATNCLIAIVAAWGTIDGLGPFVRPSPNESLLEMQAFAGLLSVLGLVAAALVAQRQRVESELRAARGDLEERVRERTSSLTRAVEALEHEVGERRRAERELRESELRWRALLEGAPDAMVIVDPRGTIVQATARTETMFGFRRDELIGQPVEILVPDPRSVFSADPHARPSAVGLELHAVRRDGTEFPVEISLSPVPAGQELLVMAAIRDITERKDAEQKIRRMNLELEHRVSERTAELERSHEALRQFYYAVGHDLQEPLRTVGSYAEMLAQRAGGRLDADADKLLGFIVDGASWMRQLLQGLLTYARVESRPRTLMLVPMDAALDHAVENLAAAISTSTARMTRGPLPTVPADEVQMVQLFQNLVGNAIKFRHPGAPLEVHVEARERDSEWVFSIRDNGIGIDPRQADRIFGIFQRLHRREEYPGTGVGLAICRKIVERHGGRMWVESEPGLGSTFYFTVPRMVGFEAP